MSWQLQCSDTDRVKKGDKVSIHYVGKIDTSSQNGKRGQQFANTRELGEGPFDFQIGSGRVIKGWDVGLLGLCVGSKATLVVPPSLAYGNSGSGAALPGGATLRYEVGAGVAAGAAHLLALLCCDGYYAAAHDAGGDSGNDRRARSGGALVQPGKPRPLEGATPAPRHSSCAGCYGPAGVQPD